MQEYLHVNVKFCGCKCALRSLNEQSMILPES